MTSSCRARAIKYNDYWALKTHLFHFTLSAAAWTKAPLEGVPLRVAVGLVATGRAARADDAAIATMLNKCRELDTHDVCLS